MNEQVATTENGGLTGGDWAMAALSFILTPLIPLILAIYNFARSRPTQGMLYLGVIGAQVVLFMLMVALR